MHAKCAGSILLRKTREALFQSKMTHYKIRERERDKCMIKLVWMEKVADGSREGNFTSYSQSWLRFMSLFIRFLVRVLVPNMLFQN